MRNFFESTKINDNIKSVLRQMRILQEKNTPITGFLTVIKNKGRKDEQIIQKDVKNLLTTSGRDFFHAQVYTNTGTGTVGANFIALSDDAVNPVVGDTTLVGEITTNGLERISATTKIHVAGTNVTTLEEIFTATAIFNGLHKSGLFNQLSIGGQMTHAREFSADVNLQVSDTVTITWILTLG